MKKYIDFQTFHFHWADYLVFAAMIFLSTGTGLFFAFYKKEKAIELGQQDIDSGEKRRKNDFDTSNMNEYLLGSRKLKIFPVSMSLVGSYVSGVTILGTVSEIYYFGTQYWMIVISIVFMAVAVSKIYLPVFSVLRVNSSYEYLEMRFSPAIRSLASIMFVMDEMFFLPIVLYVPSIAFNQVTGINVHVISTVICIICVIYTILGGIKAVVHTDAWQILVMFVSVMVVVTIGCFKAGSIGDVFQTASEGGRLIFADINPSMYQRQTLWGVLIGGFFYWTSFNAVNQTMVQRYMSLPSLRKAQWSIFIFTIGIIAFISVCCFAGLLVYEFYTKCDPMSAGLITHDDQLLPVFVMQTVGHYYGVPGLFIAGVFGAALSSLSVVLNSTALVMLEDIVKGCLRLKLTERSSTILVKGCILILGVVAVALVFVLEQLSGILSVATSVTAIAAGTTCGLFTLGMLVPWSNSIGALVGAIAGACISGWISFGSQIAFANGYVTPHKLEISVEDCPGNVTMPDNVYIDESDVFPLHRLSFHWINPIGVLTTVLVGTIVSFISGPTVLKKLDAELISPVLHRYLPKECFPPSSITNEMTRENTATHLLNDGRGKGGSETGESSDNSGKY
ncbi:sodium-coupled monocarboxylate transporter 2-like isoform X1 [Glossina fuscipes]|uniref:Sodium-coupled monocarboxylate transporter 2-like isoform X1 n=2 Tax=Glossina fuscipes TaxID=7396 RepID=A0A8U0WDI8_9MUSC|nr:sodium-coupled monocarboxylate transporter 2-like isoform X1 [Glossina fuscipes]